MNRPKASDPEVVALAVDRILVDVMEWLARGNSTCTESEVRDDLLKCVDDDPEDGYEFTKLLERDHHWDCDRELIDILDNYDLWGAHKEFEKRWVAAYQVFPSLLIGAELTYKEHPAEITELYADGKYCVFCAALGHVKKGLGTHGEIVTWESIDGKTNALGLTITGPLFPATK